VQQREKLLRIVPHLWFEQQQLQVNDLAQFLVHG
jgi:hypothetical protein